MIVFSTIVLAEIQYIIGVILGWGRTLGLGALGALGNLWNSWTTS